jgi:hypothetical protein
MLRSSVAGRKKIRKVNARGKNKVVQCSAIRPVHGCTWGIPPVHLRTSESSQRMGPGKRLLDYQ